MSTETGTLAEENIRLVHFMSENGLAGRFDAIQPFISDDLVMTLADGLPYGGTYRGWSGYLEVLGKIGQFWSEMSFAPIRCAAVDDKVVVLTSFSGSRNGRSVAMPLAEIWEIKGGKVTGITPFYFDTGAVAALAD